MNENRKIMNSNEIQNKIEILKIKTEGPIEIRILT